MKRSNLLLRTLKEPPHDADIVSHQLLERAGYVHKVGRGVYSYSPLMLRVFRKLMDIIREELDKAGAQEVQLPQLHPSQPWQQSGRWNDYIAEKLLYSFKDREEHDYCMAPTCEEIATHFVGSWIKSYKELPLNIYQFGNKFRDEIRPRFGLMRSKEFMMKDGYSYSSDEKGMEKQYIQMRDAYSEIFKRIGLDFVLVEAHGGKISATGRSQEFQATAEVGEDVVMTCGDYAANVEATKSIPPPFDYSSELLARETLPTPNVSSIEELSTFAKLPPEQILKTLLYKLIYSDKHEFVAIAIRGDRQVNPLKVSDKFGCTEIELASDEEIKKLTGSRPGFIGPLELKLPYFADLTAKPMTNFLCAFNKEDVHEKNVNWERDLPLPEFGDFLLAQEGDGCPHVKDGTFKIERGIEVGHIFNIGTRYAEKLEALYQDENGKTKPFWMGTYGIGIGRTAQAVIEQKHDERGIVWPLCLAPFKVMIAVANPKEATHVQEAEHLYALLHAFEPLYDDRNERLGFKLRDSDLMGIPYKLIIGKTFANEGKFEIESRNGEKSLITKDEVLDWANHSLLS